MAVLYFSNAAAVLIIFFVYKFMISFHFRLFSLGGNKD